VRTECGGGLSAVAVEGDELQIRSFPSAHGGHVAQAGWEHFEALDLVHHAERTGNEADRAAQRAALPGRRATVVLGPEQLALQIHESIGHALELDRIQLGEARTPGRAGCRSTTSSSRCATAPST
jgi:TldD protein